MAEATRLIDQMISIPAYTRSWYHLRDAQLAFEAGDEQAAGAEFDEVAANLSRQRHGVAFRSEVLPRASRLATYARRSDAQRRALPASASSWIRGRCAASPRRCRGRAANRRAHCAPSSGFSTCRASTTGSWRCTTQNTDEHLSDALAEARSDIAKRGDEIYCRRHDGLGSRPRWAAGNKRASTRERGGALRYRRSGAAVSRGRHCLAHQSRRRSPAAALGSARGRCQFSSVLCRRRAAHSCPRFAKIDHEIRSSCSTASSSGSTAWLGGWRFGSFPRGRCCSEPLC